MKSALQWSEKDDDCINSYIHIITEFIEHISTIFFFYYEVKKHNLFFKYIVLHSWHSLIYQNVFSINFSLVNVFLF